jgi:hypothetical protein
VLFGTPTLPVTIKLKTRGFFAAVPVVVESKDIDVDVMAVPGDVLACAGAELSVTKPIAARAAKTTT